jgi:hypothetical protein
LDEPEARPHQDHLPHHQSFRYRSWMSLRLALTLASDSHKCSFIAALK